MEFTNRMIQDEEDHAYRWYYDVKYGQDYTVIKISALIGGLVALTGFLMPLFVPNAKTSVWESGGISLGVGLFAVLLSWGVNALMYKSRGGTYRIRYIMDRYELTVLYDDRSRTELKTMGRVVSAAGILAGDVGGALTGAGMAGASQKAVFPLEKTTSIKLLPDKDMILLRRWMIICQVYVCPEDYETLKTHLLSFTNQHVRVVQK